MEVQVKEGGVGRWLTGDVGDDMSSEGFKPRYGTAGQTNRVLPRDAFELDGTPRS